MRRTLLIWAAAVVLVLLVGVLLFNRYWYYLPGLMASWNDPTGDNQPVHWMPGPDQAEYAPAQRSPNIVLILADDLGFNDLTFYGGGLAEGTVPTPHIDSIAQQGAHFANAYAGNATCAPSRAAMLTGRYATRSGFEFTPTPVQFSRLISTFPNSSPLPVFFHEDSVEMMPALDELALPSAELTIAEVLKSRDYHSILLGKWHLGGTATTRPDAQGFDEYLGFHAGGALFLPVRDANVVNSMQDFDPIDKFLWANLPFAVRYNGEPRFHPDRYMTDYLAEQAAAAIDANKNRPFFMFLSFNAPHTPLQALRADYDALGHITHHPSRVYAAMIRALDRAVGRVLRELEEQGLADNTLVIFSSDNGGAGYIGVPNINAPYRGWKATFFEGGVHVPLFVKWPAKIAPGTAYRSPVGHVDIFATAVAAAGASLPQDRTIDGVDLLPFTQPKGRDQIAHKELYFRSGNYRMLLADGWKLQQSDRLNKSWLFHLKRDPTERNNLAQSEPQRLRQLQRQLKELDAQQRKPLWPTLLASPIAVDRTSADPPVDGEEYIYWHN